MPTKRTTTCPDCALPRKICHETGGCAEAAKDYDALRRRTRALQDAGKLPMRPIDAEPHAPTSRRLPPLSEDRITEALSEVDHYRQLAHDAVATGDLATASGWLEALRDEVQAALTDPAELVAQVAYYRNEADMAAGQRDAVEQELRALRAKYAALAKVGA